jgi:hypothetical protein
VARCSGGVGYFLGSTVRAAARVRFWVDAVGVVAGAAAPGFECEWWVYAGDAW